MGMALPSLSLLLFLLSLLAAKAVAQNYLYHFCMNDKGNYTTSGAYKINLNSILLSLPTENGNGFGFFNLSRGMGTDKVNSVALCQGDVGPDMCHSCIRNATQLVKQNCPNQMEAVIWYDYCMLRYSNRTLYGVIENDQRFFMYNVNELTSNVSAFYETLRAKLNDLRTTAASGESLKFATSTSPLPDDFQTIYALVQCTPDLSQRQCSDCLDYLYRFILDCCNRKEGGRVVGASCSFRYEINPFFGQSRYALPPSPAPSPPPTISSPRPTTNTPFTTVSAENGSNTKTVIIIAVSTTVGCAILIVSLCSCFIMITKKQQIETRPLINKPVREIESAESLHISFETIRLATDDFSEDNKLGEGGFGPVYKGSLPDGQEVAVKRLSVGSGQGDLEFKNEVMLVAKLQHRNLVRLFGFCIQRSERLLVYEFVPNASLDLFLFDPSKRPTLDWERRYKIVGGIARGILYLHEDSRLRIIHRDLKASNILLDEEMNPKIADFGMARLFLVDQTQGNTSRIVGTYGYMAPEYIMHGQFSVKTDVYSFGVLLLEIISGQKNNCFQHGDHTEYLLSFAWRNWRDGTLVMIVDPLVGYGPGSDIIRCIHIALLCVQQDLTNRPTMNTVVQMLNSNSLSLPAPSEPAFFMHSAVGLDMANASSYHSRLTSEANHSMRGSAEACSTNEASITELYPRY